MSAIAVPITDDRTSKLRDLELKLADLTASRTDAFQEAIRNSLTDEEKRIYDLGIVRYSQATGRWYDPWGVPDSILDFKFILDAEDVSPEDRLTAFTILIYHDTGYPALDNTGEYNSRAVRELHMVRGTKNFHADLDDLVTERESMLTREQIAQIGKAILRHDDKFLGGVGQASRLLRIFIDGDNIFIPSFVSAYKDYISRYARDSDESQGMTGEEFIRLRLSYFFSIGEDARYSQQILITPESDRLYSPKLLPTQFPTTKQVLATHFLARTQEHEQGSFEYAFHGDWTGFRPFAKDYLDGSIDAAKLGISFDMLRFGDQVKPNN
tara:strand:+ start:476 stop:1450 length:975 start_codon:yes stop_codon:yes gene_type:complete